LKPKKTIEENIITEVAMSRIIKFIESYRIELFLLSTFAISIGLNLFHIPFSGRTVDFSLMALFLLYFFRIITSLGHWRLGIGISLLNAYCNFQIMVAVMAIGYTAILLEGYQLMTLVALTPLRYCLPVIAVFLIFRWKKIEHYWKFSKWNFFRMATATAICYILYYALDMSSPVNAPVAIWAVPKQEVSDKTLGRKFQEEVQDLKN
jgi:hypothetical protein